MKFPIKKYSNIESFKSDYYKNLKKSFEYIKTEDLKKVISILENVYKNGKNKVMVCGNGGSAALANHFACDHQKILNKIGNLKPFVLSLSSNTSLMTAISNDNNYKFVFSDQIKQIGKRSDILLAIIPLFPTPHKITFD